jgi:tRNA(Ser,Leu) C12 N-acetylase TAN1
MTNTFTTAAPKLILTSRGVHEGRRCRAAVRRALPGAFLQRTPFPGVFTVAVEGNSEELARTTLRESPTAVGHVTAVLSEVDSRVEEIATVAVQIGLQHIGESESFCFRLRKRGSHGLAAGTQALEAEIGGRIEDALATRYGHAVRVDLTHPDVSIIAEVLGPLTAVGIMRKSWRAAGSEPVGPAAPLL